MVFKDNGCWSCSIQILCLYRLCYWCYWWADHCFRGFKQIRGWQNKLRCKCTNSNGEINDYMQKLVSMHKHLCGFEHFQHTFMQSNSTPLHLPGPLRLGVWHKQALSPITTKTSSHLHNSGLNLVSMQFMDGSHQPETDSQEWMESETGGGVLVFFNIAVCVLWCGTVYLSLSLSVCMSVPQCSCVTSLCWQSKHKHHCFFK